MKRGGRRGGEKRGRVLATEKKEKTGLIGVDASLSLVLPSRVSLTWGREGGKKEKGNKKIVRKERR